MFQLLSLSLHSNNTKAVFMEKKKTVFQLAAENGISCGLYLSIIFLIIIYGNESFIFSTIGLAMIFAIPLVLFRYMRKYYLQQQDEIAGFSQIWTLGTLSFLCGSLICATVSYFWLEFITPDFIYEQAQAALAAYEQIDELKNNELTTALRNAIENNALPTAIEFVFQMLWMSFSVGVILSMLLAPFAKIGRRNKQQ